jgi:hypothetical protein
MHDTHLGSHAPPRVNQLPMAADPHDFIHIKEVTEGAGRYEVVEEGANNFKIDTPKEFQKYFGKKQAWMYIGYDHTVDLQDDEFLNSLGREEKKKFDEEMKKIWAAPRLQHEEDMWYMILEGQTPAGTSLVKLYQDKQVFKRDRDAGLNLDANPPRWSQKACYFEDLAAAKNYIQMARDEEGAHFVWPQDIPVIWKKGPISHNDIENFPGWATGLAEESEEEA